MRVDSLMLVDCDHLMFVDDPSVVTWIRWWASNAHKQRLSTVCECLDKCLDNDCLMYIDCSISQ